MNQNRIRFGREVRENILRFGFRSAIEILVAGGVPEPEATQIVREQHNIVARGVEAIRATEELEQRRR